MNSDHKQEHASRPKLGLQGPTTAWQDPWARGVSEQVMRTGTGTILRSQDPAPDGAAFAAVLKELAADFYVHHMFPGLEGQTEMLRDMARHDVDVVLGNEYGNINGPWVEGTNRWDAPDEAIVEAARSGRLIGLLYDEPEHLQINAGQYRKDGWFPHWGTTDGFSLEEASERVAHAVAGRVEHVRSLLRELGLDPEGAPLIAEHVFPVLFHVQARAGMTLCPKIMKESFQSLQLSTALGAAKQYGRELWICADLWGPDVGHWFTRTSGFPGHSPEEYASALRMGYFMGPTHLFTENVDVLMHYRERQFALTEYGEVWRQFAQEFVPAHPLNWSHAQADAYIAVIHPDDSNYGQNARLFGNREQKAPEATKSLFAIWHLLSHGTIPSHGSCMHIPGYDFPRHTLKKRVSPAAFPLEKGDEGLSQTTMHPLFYPVNNVLVFDERVTEERLGNPRLILVAGSRISVQTLHAVRKKAEGGAAVIIDSRLVPPLWKESRTFGAGCWLTTDHFLDERVREAATPYLGSSDCWLQRFGDTEVRMYKGDAEGTTLDFDITRLKQ